MINRINNRRKLGRVISVRRMRWMAICLSVVFLAGLAMTLSTKIAPWKAVLNNKSGASTFDGSPSDGKGILPPIAIGGRPRGVVFRYSIIPGGVKSVEELKNAIVSDPVVSAHYSTFHLSRARMIRLDRDRSMHVSYRVGSKVYWTKRKLKLVKGETLITDGIQSARARCGNLISETISQPVAMDEPTVQAFDVPQAPSDTDVRIEGTFPQASSSTEVPDSILPPAEADVPPQGNGNYPHVFLMPPGSPGFPVLPIWSTPQPPRHVTPVPEPSALLLLSIGLCALVILRWGRARFRSSES